MRFEGIIISGTSCAGKSTIVKELCSIDGTDEKFTQVRAVTTRAFRDDDTIYEYVSDEEFEKLRIGEELLVSSSYRDKWYGIKQKEFEEVIGKKEIPIIVITPESASNLIKEHPGLMCFFIDADDDNLLERHNKRDGAFPDDDLKKAFENQRKKDREFSNVAHYILENNDAHLCAELIMDLWHLQKQGGGVPQQLICKMIKCGMLLENAVLTGIKGASYDLRLGDEYYYGGEIRRLSEEKPFLTVEPYDYAIVSCQETANIPRDIIAKFGLSVGLFCQGIILSNGPQIDPGFRGTLFCLLFNTSNRPVHIKRRQHYATIEFNKLLDFAEPYAGKYQDRRNIIDYIPANALYGAINELKKEIEELKKESHLMQNIYLGSVALMFTIISLLLVR